MHELPITQSILDQVLKYAAKHHASSITAINLTLGEYAGYVDDSIDFYWQIIAKGTIAQNARFNITRVKGQLKCQSCGHTNKGNTKPDLCPVCKSHKLAITGGDQLIIASIRIEEGSEKSQHPKTHLKRQRPSGPKN